MNIVRALVGLSLFVTLISAGVAPCPLQYEVGSLLSARVIVAQQNSLVPLVPNTDTQCYNYSLPYSFANVPEIATAVHDFESRATNDLFFSIKPIESESLSFVPFLIRTHWRYTYWTKIVFSFIAQDRKDIEAGYYQIDSGTLGGCNVGKSIQVLMPFRNIGFKHGSINHNLFLHGFEISAQKYDDNSFSPFQVQIADSSTNSSGIALLITVTTITQVHALHISYLAWVNTDLQLISGQYIYEYDPNSPLVHTPDHNIGRNYARMFGLTGFVINHNYQSLLFSTLWDGSRFSFGLGDSAKLTQYLSFQYLFFIGSECASCPGYPYIYNETCNKLCPPGSFPTAQRICIQCGEGLFWNGTSCMKLCPTGQYLNPSNNQCECPTGLNWTGTVCLSCTSGRVFDPKTKTCQCPAGTVWNGYSCFKAERCTNGREWNVFSFSCECPVGTFWNGTFCVRKVQCTGGQYVNENNVCVCPNGTYWKDGWCQSTGCTGGQVWTGTNCACDTGFNWNGTVCLLCINQQVWNAATRSCECPANYIWNGNFCQKSITCSGGRVYRKEYDQCLCLQGQFWNGVACMVRPDCCCGQTWNETSLQCNCPSGFNWDGNRCVSCANGRVWVPSTRTCECQTGTQWNGQFCAVIQNCQGGMMWNQNTWACECPASAVWNGNYCVANTCSGGQVWNNFTKSCMCVGDKVFLNGYCQPPQSVCTYGRVWNPKTYTCQCPKGTWDSGLACETINTCRGNQVYNPINNKCICPTNLVFLESRNTCGDPTCPVDQRWNGYECVVISCPPNSFYNGTDCVCPQYSDYCEPWEYFDGYKCVYYQEQCPKGTKWQNNFCSSKGKCPSGYYESSGNENCQPLPQRCPPPTKYVNGKCVISGSNCPMGTYYRGGTCQPYAPCQNGQNWSGQQLKCVCPKGTGWNGVQCLSCGGGQVWDPFEGCGCPPGHFFVGSNCVKAEKNRCNNVPNAFWDQSKQLCLCEPGFSVSGYSCICKGVTYDHFCDRCAHRPHSQYKDGICQCNKGYTLTGNQCLPDRNDGNDRASDCGVSTYFDTQQKKCLACPVGCLSCSDCYTCNVCNQHMFLPQNSGLCAQMCGDGLRFILQCDDGNNNDGDGCSSDCTIQLGYTCRGGSPNSKDSCVQEVPQFVTITQTGQVRHSTKIVLNLKLDYLPPALIQSKDCNDRCSSILVGQIISGESKPVSINTHYIAGTRFTFSMQIQFGRPYISKFDIQVGMNPTIARQHLSIPCQDQVFSVNPAYLAKTTREDRL